MPAETGSWLVIASSATLGTGLAALAIWSIRYFGPK
jgi:hypothetical protein